MCLFKHARTILWDDHQILSKEVMDEFNLTSITGILRGNGFKKR